MKFVISTCVIALSMAVLCTAEPPSPRYLPQGRGGGGGGGSSFGAPSQQYGVPSGPSQQYGAPNGGGHGGFGQSSFGSSGPSQNYGAPSNRYLPANQGYSGNGGGDDGHFEPANYNFEYMVQDEHYGNDFGHKETRQGDRTEGQYYVLLPDGRKQIVTYEADENGYRPKISYEDSGNGNGNGYGRGPANGGYSSGSGHNDFSSGAQGPY